MHIPSHIRKKEFIKQMVAKYKDSRSPSDRKKVNVLVTMALLTRLISDKDRDKFDREKIKNSYYKGEIKI